MMSLKSAIVRASDIRVIMELLNEVLHLALSRGLRLRQRVNDGSILYNIGRCANLQVLSSPRLPADDYLRSVWID